MNKQVQPVADERFNFRIECEILRWNDSGCRTATEEEVAMWNALQSHAAAPVEPVSHKVAAAGSIRDHAEFVEDLLRLSDPSVSKQTKQAIRKDIYDTIDARVRNFSAALSQPAIKEAPVEPKLVGYRECNCVLSQYCDGKCRPIFESAKQAAPITPAVPQQGTITVEQDCGTHNLILQTLRVIPADGGIRLIVAGAVPAVPKGWKLVPVEPTLSMCDAGMYSTPKNVEFYTEDAEKAYKAMLNAAPSPAVGNGEAA